MLYRNDIRTIRNLTIMSLTEVTDAKRENMNSNTKKPGFKSSSSSNVKYILIILFSKCQYM